jgi:hypothetical protein
MNYFDWTELVTEVLQYKPFDENNEDCISAAKDNIVILFMKEQPTDLELKTRKEIRDWVQKFYGHFGHRHQQATIYKGLIDIKDDSVYGSYLSMLLQHLWD